MVKSKADILDAAMVAEQFAAFYAAGLRRQLGARMRSSEVLDAYLTWAETSGAGSITLRELRPLMQARGHRLHRSNGMAYLDVAPAVTGVTVAFAAFYAVALRRQLGARMQSTEVFDAYLAWAETSGAGSITPRELRVLMQARGHRLLKSNRMVYLDVTRAPADA